MIAIHTLMDTSGVGFGTSGARGRVEAMTDRVCYAYTLAFLQHLEHTGDLHPEGRVALAGDLRPSTPRILQAVAAAIVDCRYRPVNCGAIPTPALALYGFDNGIPSIMVTGSHIPDDRNGIKFNTPRGEILKADEAAIKAQRVSLPEAAFTAQGRLTAERRLPPVTAAPFERYVERYTRFFRPGSLEGLRIGLYEHSSVAREAIAAVLETLGAQLIGLGRSDHFVPVDTEAIRAEDIALARQWSREHRLDALVSADGDGDRPLIADESGRWLRGDIAGILCARYLGATTVATPVSCNTAVERSGWFEQVSRTRIGSPYVIGGMQEALANGRSNVVGYEANGGFLTASPLTVDGRTLTPLPTRDALVVPLALLALAEGRPLSRVTAMLPSRYTASDRLKGFPTERSEQLLGLLQRPGGAETLFGDRLGAPDAVDLTDGVRLLFANQNIVHLRPSGNAPELRCYAETDDAAGSEALVRQCLTQVAEWAGARV